MDRLCLVGVLALWACGSEAGSEAGGPCEGLDGTYEASYQARSGSCDDQAAVIRVDPSSATDAGFSNTEAGACWNYSEPSDDGCRVEVDQDCLLDGVRTVVVGTLDISRDGSRATGTWDITVERDGRAFCHGVGDVTYERL